jgi:dTMP kinase
VKKLICFEGIDGSGKTLQMTLLERRLRTLGFTCSAFSFPRYESFFGNEIGKLLVNNRGTSAASVDPKSMSLWYALDRWAAYNQEHRLSTQTDFVLVNRYTLSSVVYQSARGEASLGEWIDRLEHEALGLPRPNLYVILDVPPSITSENVRKRGVRDYVGEKKDVYEADQDLQARATALYRDYAQKSKNATVISCTHDGEMRNAEEISESVLDALRMYGLL